MAKNKNIEVFFDELAIDRDVKIRKDAIIDYEQRLRQDFIRDLLSIHPGDIILDAGSGDCRDASVLLQTLKAVPGKYLTFDLSRNMLMEGRKKPGRKNFEMVQTNLQDIPLKKETVDIIICSEVLEHIPGWEQVLSEFHRILKFRGELIVSTPNIYSMYYPQKKFLEMRDGEMHPHDLWKSYWILKRGLEKAGFEILSVRGACYLPGLMSYRGKTRAVVEKLLNRLEHLEKHVIGTSFLRYFGYIIIIKSGKRRLRKTG